MKRVDLCLMLDFIRTSQSLEIVSFVFYMIGGFLLLVALCQRSSALLFFASSISMFIAGQTIELKKKEMDCSLCLVIFSCATIVLFAVHGRSTYSGSLSFGCWLAVVALILSLISSLSLFVLSFYIQPLPNLVDQPTV